MGKNDCGRGRGQGQDQVREDVCADLQNLELKEGREGTQQHGPGAILEGAIGSCRQLGWLREILGPEGCLQTMFHNCNEEIKRQKEQTISNRNRLICRIYIRSMVRCRRLLVRLRCGGLFPGCLLR